MTFREHRSQHLVTGLKVRRKLAQQIGNVSAYPQGVMRIDDAQLGLEDGFLDLAEPGLVLAAAIVEAIRHQS